MRQRLPIPPGLTSKALMAQGVASGTAWRAIQRGYLTCDYHQRTQMAEGDDRLLLAFDTPQHLLNFCGHIVRAIGARWGLDIAELGRIDPATTDYEDLVQASALRCVELRAHPLGCRPWYSKVITNEVRAVLHRGRQRRHNRQWARAIMHAGKGARRWSVRSDS
jgi:hypothetical protein